MAFTFDTHSRTANNLNPDTLSYTCGANSTLLVLSIVTGGSAPVTIRSGGAPTYNGVEFTFAGSDTGPSGTNETCAEIWYMPNPPTGSALTISVPNTAVQNLALEASTYNGPVGKTPFVDNFTSGKGTSTNPSNNHTLNGNQGCVVVAVIGSGAQTWAPSGRTGTQLDDTDVSSFGDGEQYFLAPTATQAVGWTFGTSDDWVICAASFAHDFSGLPNNYQAINSSDKGVATYYFDGSDAAATDPNAVWTNDAEAFNNDITTPATTVGATPGSVSLNYLMAEGTNAPSNTSSIFQVRARIYSDTAQTIPSTNTNSAAIYTNALGELLGTALRVNNPANTPGYGDYVILSTPSAGWDWATIQALETKIYTNGVGGAGNTKVFIVEVEVTYSTGSLMSVTEKIR